MTKVNNLFGQWFQETFKPVKHKAFRNLWIAGAASNVGSVIQITTASWLMTTLTDSVLMISLVQTAAMLPLVLFAILAGASADLNNKRIQMLAGNLLSLCAVAALIAIVWLDQISPILLLLFTALIATGLTAMLPAWQSSIIELVPRDDLPSSISLNTLAFNVARATGPAIGAEVIAIGGILWAFGVNLISYAIIVAVLLSWAYRPAPSELPKERWTTAVQAGVRYVFLSPGLLRHIARGLMLTFAASAIISLPPAIALSLNAGARGYGILLTSFGIGAIMGSLSVAWVRSRIQPSRQFTLALMLLASAAAALSFANSLMLAAIVLFVAGMGWIQAASTLQVTVQMACPKWVTGRTIAVFSTTFSLGLATGAAWWGLVADNIGLPVALWGCAGLLLVITAISALMEFYNPDAEDLQTKIVVDQASISTLNPNEGPIHVSVKYRVAKSNAEEFQRLMLQYAQRRKRDGVRGWSLVQDIDEPTLWVEAFRSPTWGDFLHRVSRILIADDMLREQIWSLCEEEPKFSKRLDQSNPDAEPRVIDWIS
jgi:predicted MFS family arabinose efflux permease